MVSAARRVASSAWRVLTREVTNRYRCPFERATDPTAGSTTTRVSGESGRRSCSATRPSFSWRRAAMRASRMGGRTGRSVAGSADKRPEMAGRWRASYNVPPTSDVDAQGADPDTARGRREGRQQLARAQAELLGADRGVRLDIDREALDPDDAAGAGGRRDALVYERFERRDGARQAQLVLEPELAGGVRDQVAEAGHRAPAGAHAGTSPRISRAPPSSA